MIERKGGYYYVLLVNLNWTIAYWDKWEKHWIMLGTDIPSSDSEFLDIKEEQIKIPHE